MRLWHESLIPLLPNAQLLGQHRECCALRGNGWGKKHSVVNYVFEHSYRMLFKYHKLVMNEMVKRGYKVSPEWMFSLYRGKQCESASHEFYSLNHSYRNKGQCIYPEHNSDYLTECLENLRSKGIIIKI